MKWKLADATPRRIYLDSAFVEGLHQALAWDSMSCGRDAMLEDLHPSLANLDHVRRLISTLRNTKYPSGTGFEGMQSPLICSLVQMLKHVHTTTRCSSSCK